MRASEGPVDGLHAGLSQSRPRPLTTTRMTARRARQEVHPRPTDRRTSTEATLSTTRRDRSSATARTPHQDNEETQSSAAAARWAETAASASIDQPPHDSTLDEQGHERRTESHEPWQGGAKDAENGAVPPRGADDRTIGRCSLPQQLHAGQTPPHPRPVAHSCVEQQ